MSEYPERLWPQTNAAGRLNALAFDLRVTSLDAHPVSVKTPASAEKSLVLQAMGTVTINGVSRAYNQVLILQLAGGNYHIKSDSHRLIE